MTAPRVACLVLAAGRSTRMAPHNKLLLRDGDGVAMVARVAAACAASRAAHVVVVTGHQAGEVVRAVGAGAAHFAHAPDHADGLSASLAAGIRALPPWVDGVVVCLGDMPLVDAATIDRVIDAFAPESGKTIVVPTWQGGRGNPVLWGRALFGQLCSLSGDAGARRLLPIHADRVVTVDADGPGVLTDFDMPSALAGFWHPPVGQHA